MRQRHLWLETSEKKEGDLLRDGGLKTRSTKHEMSSRIIRGQPYAPSPTADCETFQAQKCSVLTNRTTIPLQRLDSLLYAPRHEGMRGQFHAPTALPSLGLLTD